MTVGGGINEEVVGDRDGSAALESKTGGKGDVAASADTCRCRCRAPDTFWCRRP